MSDFEEFKKYLPQYLSPESQKDLFDGLDQFPPQFDQSLFSTRLEDETDLFQGDGLRDMPVVNLPDPEILTGPVMVISNTCDTSFENTRNITPSLIYCPIVPLSLLANQHGERGMAQDALDDLLDRIRSQKVTRWFFLPKFGGLPEDCVALLDHTNSCSMDYLTPENVKACRLFTLSNKGLWFFVVKLGIHFTRLFETDDRG